MALTLCGPATEEIRREADGERWCFVCRTAGSNHMAPTGNSPPPTP